MKKELGLVCWNGHFEWHRETQRQSYAPAAGGCVSH